MRATNVIKIQLTIFETNHRIHFIVEMFPIWTVDRIELKIVFFDGDERILMNEIRINLNKIGKAILV